MRKRQRKGCLAAIILAAGGVGFIGAGAKLTEGGREPAAVRGCETTLL